MLPWTGQVLRLIHWLTWEMPSGRSGAQAGLIPGPHSTLLFSFSPHKMFSQWLSPQDLWKPQERGWIHSLTHCMHAVCHGQAVSWKNENGKGSPPSGISWSAVRKTEGPAIMGSKSAERHTDMHVLPSHRSRSQFRKLCDSLGKKKLGMVWRWRWRWRWEGLLSRGCVWWERQDSHSTDSVVEDETRNSDSPP